MAVGWGLVGFALWNALFEMMVVRGVKDGLLRVQVTGAEGGPPLSIRAVMDPAIHHAAWVATAWTALVWLAAALTILYASSHPRLEPHSDPGPPAGDAQR